MGLNHLNTTFDLHGQSIEMDVLTLEPANHPARVLGKAHPATCSHVERENRSAHYKVGEVVVFAEGSRSFPA
ncbi:MAG: hypothetical protein KME19_11865 [Microcoleus vaginatus WJT46-NPBG5]|nr:hypothetical protein [Microcoleus vaginatus WJT46-NPBG5]